MPASIQDLIADPDIVALTFRRRLEPLEGPDVPVFPPTYPVAKDARTHRHDTPYTVNRTKDGAWVCDLDSVQSQANRMEAAFGGAGALADVVPQHAVRAGGRQIALTDLPHRVADAAIRATGCAGKIRAAMLAAAAGDARPLARLAPTSLVYGAWDSRDTHVKLPRMVRSEIRAHDVSVFTRSAQYSGAFGREDLGLTEAEWRKGADIGFAPAPSVDAAGGVLAHGDIAHTASILLSPARGRGAGGDGLLPAYLLGLALGGLLEGAGDYTLRSGCALVPAGPAEWRTVSREGERREIAIEKAAVLDELRAIARDWAREAGVELGGEPQIHDYSPAAGKEAFAAAKKSRPAEGGE